MNNNQEEIQKRLQLEERLYNAAKVLGSVIGPDYFRLVNFSVRIGDYHASMSIEHGLSVRLPTVFHGHVLAENVALAMGLLAHELAHALQPLAETTAVVSAGLVPAWFENLILDIAGESFVQRIIPSFGYALRTPRSVTSTAMMAVYRKQQKSKQESIRLQAHLLAARFSRPQKAFNVAYFAWDARIDSLIRDIGKAIHITPGELPAFLTELSEKYPELQRLDDEQEEGEGQGEGEGEGAPDRGDESSEQGEKPEQDNKPHRGTKKEKGEKQEDESEEDDKSIAEPVQVVAAQKGEEDEEENIFPDDAPRVTISREVQAILQQLVGMIEITSSNPGDENTRPIIPVARPKRSVTTEMDQLSRSIQVRFGQPHGNSKIVAPGYMDRRELALGGVQPYRMNIRGVQTPGPNVILCLDESESMNNRRFYNPVPGFRTKQDIARLVAKSVAMSIERAGGQVRGLVFATHGVMDLDHSADVLWQGNNVPNMAEGETAFWWLTEVWESFPDSLILIITDGEGSVPQYVSQHNKKRTKAIILPPGKTSPLDEVCSQVVELADVTKLSTVLSTLIPVTTYV